MNEITKQHGEKDEEEPKAWRGPCEDRTWMRTHGRGCQAANQSTAQGSQGKGA